MQDRIDQLLRTTPNLKRSEIARELGLSKSDVSRLLHGDKERYVQDDEYRWRLVDDEVLITLPGRWISASRFESLLWRSTGGSRPAAMRFELESGCSLLIECIARLLAVSNQCAADGCAVVLDFTKESAALSYLNRSGFLNHIHPDVVFWPSKPENSLADTHRGNSPALVELAEVDPNSENSETKERLTDAFVAQTNEGYMGGVFTIFGELIDNIKQHSEAQTIGLAGLQKYSKPKNHVQAVISDNGVGIAHTLRYTLEKYHPALHKRFGTRSVQSDMDLVKTALLSGQISRNGSGGGLGFKRSGDLARKLRANICVRQERFYLKLVYSGGELTLGRACTDVYPLRGTHICFDFLLE